jgi:hypothetical protein
VRPNYVCAPYGPSDGQAFPGFNCYRLRNWTIHMAAKFRGTVREVGRYADGTPALEIHVPRNCAGGLPFSVGVRVRIILRFDGIPYDAGLRATERNDYVWVSPDLRTVNGTRTTLGHILTRRGIWRNANVLLIADGHSISVENPDALQREQTPADGRDGSVVSQVDRSSGSAAPPHVASRHDLSARFSRDPFAKRTFDSATAIRAIRNYNDGRYRGRPNLDLDRIAYDRFGSGLPNDPTALIDMVRFVGEEYGGAQLRFLPHGFREEAGMIVDNLLPLLRDYQLAIAASRPFNEAIPPIELLTFLLAPFRGTKRWPVWATKTLHFLRPDVFPILDSRAKITLGLDQLGSSPQDYRRFCLAFHAALAANRDSIAAARIVDGGASPTDLKLLDKILYQLGDAAP